MKPEELYQQALSFEDRNQYSKAVSVYKQLVSEENDSRYYIAYGVCLQKLSHWKQSVEMLEKGIKLNPSYCEGDARLFLAESYLNAGNKKKAIEQWRIVEKMEPEYPSYEKVPNEAKRMLEKHA